MTSRRLHAAPPDYGIVELLEPDGSARVLLYHWGTELLGCQTVEAARRLAEAHRLASRRGAVKPGPQLLLFPPSLH